MLGARDSLLLGYDAEVIDKAPNSPHAPKVILSCDWCGTQFKVLESRLKHMTGKGYCSKECSYKGRGRTRKEKGSSSREAMLKAQAASQTLTACTRGCGQDVVRANFKRHVDACLWPRTWDRFEELGKLQLEGDCLIWNGPGAKHYGAVGAEHAHREAWRISNGDACIPDDLVVRHTCDRKGCVNPAHLLLGTVADNTRDAMERGRHKGGFDTWPKEKLNEMLKTKRWPRSPD